MVQKCPTGQTAPAEKQSEWLTQGFLQVLEGQVMLSVSLESKLRESTPRIEWGFSGHVCIYDKIHTIEWDSMVTNNKISCGHVTIEHTHTHEGSEFKLLEIF